MNHYLQLAAYPTNRACWIDPFRVGAIMDAVEARQAKVLGGQPELVIVGTSLVIDGATVTIAGPADEVRRRIEHARTGALQIAN